MPFCLGLCVAVCNLRILKLAHNFPGIFHLQIVLRYMLTIFWVKLIQILAKFEWIKIFCKWKIHNTTVREEEIEIIYTLHTIHKTFQAVYNIHWSTNWSPSIVFLKEFLGWADCLWIFLINSHTNLQISRVISGLVKGKANIMMLCSLTELASPYHRVVILYVYLNKKGFMADLVKTMVCH